MVSRTSLLRLAPTTLRTFVTSRLLRAAPEKEIKAATANYNRPPAPRSRATGTQLPVLPLVVIFIVGTASFYQLAKSRDGQGSSHYVLPTRDNEKNRQEILNNRH
ncbi:hypothetical protein BDV97DRAFT_395801 [Delphinella strobiligena]|nr:hypothetical protein BDV97DRAFT_395801 [Delphinella strobiligena]